MSEFSDGLDVEPGSAPDARSGGDTIADTATSPDLDAIAIAFDEIEQALRRLDNGTYFAPDDGSSQPPAPTATVGDTPAS